MIILGSVRNVLSDSQTFGQPKVEVERKSLNFLGIFKSLTALPSQGLPITAVIKKKHGPKTCRPSSIKAARICSKGGANMFAPSPRAATKQLCGSLISVTSSMTDSGGAAETGVRPMEDIRAVVTRLPRRELDIRRRCARDADFRSICMDYEEAARALRYWQKVAHTGDREKEADRNIAEYQSLLDELEAEILAHLNRSNAQQC
jgi:hypothetical protein